MRVTENANYETIRSNISRSRGRMEKLQGQTATLRKLNHPSDDPIGAAKVLELRTDKMNHEQFQVNAKLAETFLHNADQALADLTEIVVRAKEIALSQSSAASSSEATRLGVAEEVTQLFREAVSIGNRRVGDRFLFGGYRTNKPPVDAEGNYLGDNGQMMVEIANEVFISMNIPGNEVFNTNPKLEENRYKEKENKGLPEEDQKEFLENVNIFNELQNFRIALLTGHLDGVRDELDRLDQIHSKLVATRAKLGSRLQGIEATSQAMERHTITNAYLSSALEDADMAQVVSDLSKEETVFKSSLASSQRLIQPTLLDFLK